MRRHYKSCGEIHGKERLKKKAFLTLGTHCSHISHFNTGFNIALFVFLNKLMIMMMMRVLRRCPKRDMYTGWAKKLHTVFMAITLSTLNHFS